MIDLIHWIAGVVILAEALNKLERCNPMAPGLTCNARVVDALKALAWALLALAGGGAIVTPLLPLEAPTLQDTALAAGFATLIIRTRLKEG